MAGHGHHQAPSPVKTQLSPLSRHLQLTQQTLTAVAKSICLNTRQISGQVSVGKWGVNEKPRNPKMPRKKVPEMQGNALRSFFSKCLIGSVWLRPHIRVLRPIAPEILSPPRSWQTPGQGQRAEEGEHRQVLIPSTALFRDVLPGHAAQRSGSLAATSRGNLAHSPALQNIEGYPRYASKMLDVLLKTSDGCWLESHSLISFLCHLEVSPDGTLGFSLVQIKAVNPCLTFHR